jgi:hypothetical protein
MASFFQDKNLHYLLNSDKLKQIITTFRHRVDAKEILLGGSIPPSSKETNVLTQRYDPLSKQEEGDGVECDYGLEGGE